nr:hypothetical protein [Tanacetum cinerariifolium]
LGNGFAPQRIGDNIPNNKNGWIEEEAEEKEEDSKEEPKDDDDDMEMDDEAEVINPYMDDGSNNLAPPNSEDEETPPTSPVIPDADGQPIPHIASFGQNFHFCKSSSTANLLTGNSKIVPTGPMCPNLGTVWKRLGKMEKFMSERIDTEGRIKKKFKEQDSPFLGLGYDNIEMDRKVRNVMSNLSGLKKLVKGLSDRFYEYERSKVFDAKRVLEKELVIERNAKEFYREFVREPPAEPSARPVPAPYPDDPYVVTKDAAIADAAIATFCIDDDDDDTAPMDSQPYEPREVTSSELATLNKAVWMEHTLMEQKVKVIAEREADNKKRKWENFQGGSSSGGGNNNSNRNNNNYNSNPRDCWSKVVATSANTQLVVTCYGCREKDHIKTNCPERNNPRRGRAHGQAYALRDGNQNLGPNVVTGNKTVRDGQLEFANLVAVDKRQSRLPSLFIQLRNPCA